MPYLDDNKICSGSLGGFSPKPQGEQKFVANQSVRTVDDPDPEYGPTLDQHIINNVKMFDRSAERYGYNPGQDADAYVKYLNTLDQNIKEQYLEAMDLLAEDILNEILKPSMGASKYIDDFVHPTDKRFDGKSKKERIKMALGAFYAAKREANEDVNESIFYDVKKLPDWSFQSKYGMSKDHFMNKIEMPLNTMRRYIKTGKIITSHFYESYSLFEKLPRITKS